MDKEIEKCPKCGVALALGIRPMTINYEGLSATFDMPGAYCKCGEGILTARNMDILDRQLNFLKAEASAHR